MSQFCMSFVISELHLIYFIDQAMYACVTLTWASGQSRMSSSISLLFSTRSPLVALVCILLPILSARRNLVIRRFCKKHSNSRSNDTITMRSYHSDFSDLAVKQKQNVFVSLHLFFALLAFHTYENSRGPRTFIFYETQRLTLCYTKAWISYKVQAHRCDFYQNHKHSIWHWMDSKTIMGKVVLVDENILPWI
mgnify:CR=1 FL=1